MTETILALSSGALPAGIAVVRLSGPNAHVAAESIAGGLPPPREARVRTLHDPKDGATLDRSIVLRFDGPATATGEDIVEFHLHGGRAVVTAVEGALLRHPGVRRAEAGEFTRRALLNGRIDLTQVEGLGDLLAAESESQRRAALRAAEGGIRRQVDIWNQQILTIAARVEAAIDFSDEDDVDAQGSDSLVQLARMDAAVLARDMRRILAQPAAETLHRGLRVVLAGPPNAGKSSLFNRLIDREAAIVSPIAGTTRDRIEASVVIGDHALVLVDTAGLAEATDDPIEAIGIARADEAARGADILIWLGPGPAPDHPGVSTIPVHSKADLERPLGDRIAVSSITGEGIAALLSRIEGLARELLPPADAVALRSRHRDLVSSAASAIEATDTLNDPLLVAEGLREAMRSLDRITGTSDTEAMLDTLFAGFCIGK